MHLVGQILGVFGYKFRPNPRYVWVLVCWHFWGLFGHKFKSNFKGLFGYSFKGFLGCV